MSPSDSPLLGLKALKAGLVISFKSPDGGFRFGISRDVQRESRWTERNWRRLKTLRGERVCVVGLGTLGQGVVRRAEAFSMEVVEVKRTPTPVDSVSRVYTSAELEEAIEGSTFVVLCVSLTDGTRRLIGPEELEAMADDAYLVNVSRGGVVDERALIEALKSGVIAGAALDVFDTEPLPQESLLWEMDEVIVTPHIAGAHEEYADRVSELVRENLRRQEAGESLVNRVVGPAVGVAELISSQSSGPSPFSRSPRLSVRFLRLHSLEQ